MQTYILSAMAISLLLGLAYTVILNDKLSNDDELLKQNQ